MERTKPTMGRIVILTGAPGTGKSTVAALLAQRSGLARSVHMHTDDFYGYLSKGAVPPHLPEADDQNRIVTGAFLEAAKAFAQGGYEVVVDGVVGPWFLNPWLEAARAGWEIHYIILRASREETLSRALGREKLTRAENTALVETMWHQFTDLGPYEAHVLTTDGKGPEETAAAVGQRVAAKTCLL